MTQSIREVLLAKMEIFTPSEQKVAKVLLDQYPSLGLSAISNVAGHAGVSDPTVFRFVVKLGFEGYASFQQSLLAEIDMAMNTPLARMRAFHSETSHEAGPERTLLHVAKATENTAAKLDTEAFGHAADLLADPHAHIYCGGGRYTAFLASTLAYSMAYVRPHVRHIDPALPHTGDTLVDMGPEDVFVVFDFRRYQRSVIEFAHAVKQQGTRVVLITDEWTSPIGSFADVVLRTYAEAFSVIDTKVPALALCEALVVSLANRQPEQARQRVEKLEALRMRCAASDAALPDGESPWLDVKAKRLDLI
ncbi:RpiR family transcriptional regulator [Pandoraea terrae]|uniref:RpiR family transcriptional regulator n=1 Tax=Pandoraea terrae TaxID=1537710 RepID=A0A5E4Z8C9_9BURK|nr:MurR/RpiR family transcriptional regulator [Pandoraea terrae]VVE56932.1 RpiR family transcriptional regulator [Pandoraea terrae]